MSEYRLAYDYILEGTETIAEFENEEIAKEFYDRYNNYKLLKAENSKLKEILKESICIIHDYSDRIDAKINGCDIDVFIENSNKLLKEPV